MRTFTYLISFLTLILFLAPPAKAQGLPDLPLPDIETSECFYENPCFTASYEQFSISADSTTLIIVVAIVPVAGGDCSDTERIAVTALGGDVQQFTLAELEENPNVVLEVNRAEFLLFPQVGIAALDSIQFEGQTLPILFPTHLIALNARIDTEDPCLPITPLPVELISFEGKPTAGGIALEWSTASEKDNSHFEVERSADGQAFEQIGEVAGNGNSSVKLRYNYTDNAPNSNLNYYRLKQVDFSGQSEYSKVITVTANALASSSELSINLAPNPCIDGDCAAIITSPASAGPVDLQLKDLSGRVVFTKTIPHEGRGELKLPMQELATYKGLFILTATSGKQVVHKRVVLR